MKTDKKILIAFLLNLVFSLFEFAGGLIIGSVAILSDALHDIGDAASIGLSYFLEKKSKKQPDSTYTYGYARYSVLGSMATTMILLTGSILMIISAIQRIFRPVPIHYDGMILFAVIGAAVNICAAWFTRNGETLNQKAVNLHMLEDVLGWLVVLIGAVIMRFTDFYLLDSLLSIAVSLFILINAAIMLKEALEIILEKIPHGISMEEIRAHLLELEEVIDVHHIHIRSTDGFHIYATMHIVTDADPLTVKRLVRSELTEHGIHHATLELEAPGEHCDETHCHIEEAPKHGHHHHHHHH